MILIRQSSSETEKTALLYSSIFICCMVQIFVEIYAVCFPFGFNMKKWCVLPRKLTTFIITK